MGRLKGENGKMGRRVRLNEIMIKKICDLIKAGNFEYIAATLSGISDSTLRLWKNTGAEQINEGKNTIYTRLYEGMMEANAYAMAYHVQNVREAGKKSWQASAWWLERKYPDEFGNRYKLEERKVKILEERLELERMQAVSREPDDSSDNFIDALNDTAEEVWGDEEAPMEE